MLQFDDATARILETAYQGGDFRRRRRASFDALDPSPGQFLADIGCGNGLLTVDLAHAAGPAGQVIGIDPSHDMLALARRRLEDLPQAWLETGTAESLPIGDGELDGAVSLQVFEYLPDPAAAVREACRVLKTGGRLVLGDMHFGTLAWHSDLPERMERMKASWNQHVENPALPVRLPSILNSNGFAVESIVPVTFTDTDLRPDGTARMMMILMENYAVTRKHLSADEARAWAEEQEKLAAEGRFFFTLTHFVIAARKH